MRKTTGSHSKRAAANLYLVEPDSQLEASRSRKTWTQKDCIDVTPLTDRQEEAFRCWYQRDDSCLAMIGSAGVGKSLVACYLAINDVLNPATPQKQVVIVRSCVPTRQTGYLPGSQQEKEEIYQLPYVDIFATLFKRKSTYQDMVDAGIIKFVSTSYVRGLTLDRSIVIFDEIQSATRHECDSIATRLGDNSRLIVLGDGYQNDLHSKKGTEISGFDYMVSMMTHIDMFDVVQFTHDDIVRSSFCKSWIIESERHPQV
jgi:predicted ribonuclease YlaK